MDQSMTLISIIIALVLAFIGYYLNIYFSSKYRIKGGGHHKECYQVIEKVSHQESTGFIHSMRLILTKSSLDNAVGFMDLLLTNNSEIIYVNRYAFINSFTHVIISPGKYILHESSEWIENQESDGFKTKIKTKRLNSVPYDKIPNKIKRKISNCIAVESSFEFPLNYTGYCYTKRLVVLAKGIGIVFCQVEYSNQNKDTYRLEKFRVPNKSDCWFPFNNVGNFWIYDIEYQTIPTQHIICE